MLNYMRKYFEILFRFAANLYDHLNAEIGLGSVTDVNEAIEWLGYTYLFVRMRKNPTVYGVSVEELTNDPVLRRRRQELIENAASQLHRNQMIVFEKKTGSFIRKDLGRIAASFYIKMKSVETFNKVMHPRMVEGMVKYLWH